MNTIKKLQTKYITFFILPIFSFLLGCMLMINLVPINRTCKLDDTDREYNIMKNSKLKTPELIVLILSAPKNLDNRTTIRNTWIKLEALTKTVVRHYFVTGGAGLTTDDIFHLSSEQSRFNDLLILPLHDSYGNLTTKVINSFVWLSDQLEVGLDFKYVLKCDDDSFVRVDKLVSELAQIEEDYLPRNSDMVGTSYVRVNVQTNNDQTLPLQLYWGYFNGHAQVKTTGKWKEDNWILCEHYLPYALGGGYVLSKGLVVFLAKNAKYLRFYNSEDVSVGAWLSSVNNILRIHDRRFDTEWVSRGCQNSHLVSHHLTKQQMYAYNKNIITSGNLCEMETVKRDYYLYNWSVPPSKCCNKKW